MLTLDHFNDESEAIESGVHRVELFGPGEDAPAALDPAERPLVPVPSLVGFAVEIPFGPPVCLRSYNRRHP